MSDDFTIHAVFPNYHDGTRVSYSFRALLDGMTVPGVEVRGYVLGIGPGGEGNVRALLPRTFYKHTSRLVKNPCRSIVARFGRWMKPGDVVHLWIDSPVEVIQALQRRGLLVVREMINCSAERCRVQLSAAHAALGIEYRSPITDAVVARERNQLLAADAVFCPNDAVLESVGACGVPADRCIATSYGWSPERLRGHSACFPEDTLPRFLFVGSGDVRKGLPWLLRSWERAGIDGRLLIAGHVDEGVRASHASILARNDVIELGHVSDIGAAYRSADVFCFTSWEEGGPMVTIEAMGMGLPCIVSPMGSAGILSAASGGAIIVDPGNLDAIGAALRTLAGDAALRRRLGSEARSLAADYVWSRVGGRRTQLLRELREARRQNARVRVSNIRNTDTDADAAR